MVHWNAPSSALGGSLLVARSIQDESQEQGVDNCCYEEIGDVPE